MLPPMPDEISLDPFLLLPKFAIEGGLLLSNSLPRVTNIFCPGRTLRHAPHAWRLSVRVASGTTAARAKADHRKAAKKNLTSLVKGQALRSSMCGVILGVTLPDLLARPRGIPDCAIRFFRNAWRFLLRGSASRKHRTQRTEGITYVHSMTCQKSAENLLRKPRCTRVANLR